jgi:hypothetical protein
VHGVPRRRRLVSAVGVVAALALAACSDASSATPPTATPTSRTTATIGPASPSPSSKPSLSPKQQAAEEARAAYANYQSTIDRVYQAGGDGAKTEFPKIAAAAVLKNLLSEAEEIQKLGWRQIGGIITKAVKVDSIITRRGRLPQAKLTACIDTGSRRVLDSKGKEVRRQQGSRFYGGIIILTQFGNSWRVTNDELAEVKSC